MSNLTRWNPYREMANFRRAMNRLFEDPFYQVTTDWDQPVTWDLPLDVVEKDDEYVVKASLPGINPDDLEITYNNNTLTIRGEMKSDQEEKDEDYVLRERRMGSFTRSISLPVPIQQDQISANFEDGVLTLHLPKTEEVKPRRIPISGKGGQKVIEAQTTGQRQGQHTRQQK